MNTQRCYTVSTGKPKLQAVQVFDIGFPEKQPVNKA